MLVRPAVLAFTLALPVFASMPGAQPLRVIRTVEPRFPDALAQTGIYEGEARVIVLVDAQGTLADWLLAGFSHPLLGREATEAVRQWRFEPARRNGEPVDIRTEMVFSFHSSGRVVSVSPLDLPDSLQRRGVDRSTDRLCRPSELDAPITPTQTVVPLWPGNWNATMKEGSVTLDFYIDGEGRPRMPAVIRTDHEALNFPAIEALSHWRFIPPTRRGEPVIVRATQLFRFRQRS